MKDKIRMPIESIFFMDIRTKVGFKLRKTAS